MEIRRNLRPSYVRKLIRAGEGCCAGELRVYRAAADFALGSFGVIDYAKVQLFAEDLKQHSLEFSELWAFGLMLRLALVEKLSRHLQDEPVVSDCIRSLWALEGLSWREFVESASATEELLRQDPAGIYPSMDFETRDLYRHVLEKLTRRSCLSEKEIARALLERAESALRSGATDPRKNHIGFYLIGPGAREFRRSLEAQVDLSRLDSRSSRTMAESVLRRRLPAVDGAYSGRFCSFGWAFSHMDYRVSPDSCQPGGA